MMWLWLILALVALLVVASFAWRYASRRWSVPCPTWMAAGWNSRLAARVSGAETTLDRMEIRPGERVLEMGPGPGRLLIPAARRVLPGGAVVGLDIQRGMLERLKARAVAEGLTNLSVIHGDATRPHVRPGTFDLVFLCTVLGEVPDREAALSQARAALKPGGRLAVTEMFGDPHYQTRGTVDRLARAVGFQPRGVRGHWYFYTALFEKPAG